ncbi:MAG TPA: hypothetical protein VGR02_02860 [Thermoanaerobaculia bacterium]|jgi:hypothetical protein|nr:hypothetical protein [Thermoanaerobaculia bacterium]
MQSAVVSYLSGRPEAATFLLPADLARTLEELFPRGHAMLPQPYKIFPADETQPPSLGFAVADAQPLKELEARLDRWLAEEIAWQLDRKQESKERATLAFNAYISHLMKLAENALMSNLLNDYHAIFWLAHSLDLARHFSTVVRGVSKRDSHAGRTQGEALKYRIFARWAAETREQMTQLAARAASTLEGEEQRGLQFFRLLQDDVLILTEEFIGPDLRELRSFITGYLRRDFQAFRDGVERLREAAVELLLRDRTFKASLPLFGTTADQGITLALLLDSRFQAFLFEHPTVENAVTREEREQFQLIARRLREYSVLNQLRRGIVWMTTTGDGQIVPVDRRGGGSFSRSTRPLDFGRPGVVDPMIHRFGIIYDISSFSETLGNIRRGGRKEEISSYRQMLLFQRKLEGIAQRHLLQFEKFLGDGAFYTTRRALRVIRAAVEIQRFYAEMRRKGFAFNKGLRIALNYGYYRLLPMKGSPESPERITEFYGPGIVELSRLTTGKSNKEIEEFAAFLVARGYDSSKVQQFFAPLERGVDMIDHTQHAREFYAYLNANGNLVNEGIVTSFSLLQELSGELTNEGQGLLRVRAPFGSYIGFAPAVAGLESIGIRLLGSVSLKGLDNIEIGEVVPFAPGEAETTPIDAGESLVSLLRQELHQDRETFEIHPFPEKTTHEHAIENEIVICVRPDSDDLDEVLIGLWDPRSDDVRNPLRMPRGDFIRLFSLRGALTVELLADKRSSVRDLYHRLTDMHPTEPVPLADFRGLCETFLLGEVVEKL